MAKTKNDLPEAVRTKGDDDTADTEISRSIDKHLWFVEAHIGAER